MGTGSTLKNSSRLLPRKWHPAFRISGVPSPSGRRASASSSVWPLKSLDELPELDLTIDGADEVDGKLRSSRAGGGALLREKIVASASARMIVIADESKVVDVLAFQTADRDQFFRPGRHELAIEKTASRLGLAGDIVVRSPATEPSRPMADTSFSMHLCRIPDADALAVELNAIPGVVEHGFFIEWRRWRSLPVLRSAHAYGLLNGSGRAARAYRETDFCTGQPGGGYRRRHVPTQEHGKI
ncbi:ribose 5-phosphate isomerase A [Sinorhizobium meliloti]|nr:ribose 5-phosphate isomerase A [Sinorhizobium meliloti]